MFRFITRQIAHQIARHQARRSTARLLAQADDRLLRDIGLTRAQVEAMHLGLSSSHLQSRTPVFPSGRALPVRVQA